MVLKAFKLRLYPNKTQRNQIHVNFGCARFVWNQMLNMHIERYKNNRKAKLQGRYSMDVMLKSLKIEYPWLKEDILKVDDRLNKQLRIWERKKSRRYENAKKAMAFDEHDKVLFPRTDLKQFPRYQQAVRTVAKLKKHIAERRRDNLHKLTTRWLKIMTLL
ncbi:helix-turn-helix domain-containing protein [Ligilactobacillus ruminis]|uniref:helix-turn-helix domain-containing protein n=1 Tax=Ligilactobacillus ruminis TaxID=1623 RepID=UPI003F9C7E25